MKILSAAIYKFTSQNFSLMFLLVPSYKSIFFVAVFLFQGAATSCYVALHPSLKGVTGKYFVDCNEFAPGKLATDTVLAKQLWDFSNKLVNSA